PSIPAGVINLNYANPNGTNADVSVDYITYTATIAAGSTSVVITVPVVDDLVVESDTEQVTLQLLDGAPFAGDPKIQYGTTSGPTLLFQQGTAVDGIIYTGTVDTFINNDIQGQSYETQNFISVSPLLPPAFANGPLHGLIRFDNFIGANLIPANSRLSGASLVFNGAFTNTVPPSIVGPAVQPSIFQLQPAATWPAASTWAGQFGGNGIQANGVEASAQFVTGTFTSSSVSTFTSTGGTNGTSVLAAVQSWVNGSVNNGWAILPGNVGWDAFSSENSGFRPALSLTIATSATASIVDNDSAKISITSLNGTEPGGPLFLAPPVTVSTVSHTGTQAVLTTAAAHGMSVGQTVRIATGDTRFDGTFVLGAGTGGSTLVYTNSNPSIVVTNSTFFGTPTAQLVNLIGQANAGRAIVSIDKPSSSNTIVTYTITDGTALGGGVDYTAPTTTQTVTIPAGLTSATISIEVNDDFTVEGQEDVIVTLVAIPTNTTAATNDDTDPQITFDVIKSTSVKIDDNDVGNISITKLLDGSENNPDPRNVVNKVLTSNIATITTSGAAHTFTPGEQVLVSIGDSIFDGEYVVLAVPAPTANTFSYIKSNLNVPSTAVVSGTAANQPTDGKFLISTTNASNTPTLIPYSIVLNSPVLNNATLGAGKDYELRANNTVLTGTITLPALLTSVEVTIDVLEDFLNEGDEDVTVQLLAPTGKLGLGAPTIATAKILDDDDLIVSIVTPDNSVTEGADAGVNDGL
ncbi:MAG TPA: Calx-beta domain-containing protein, partial [Pirellula sp.]|nr:Calx-beta domain-containing protein [Pirellula sp.]